ncbi:MAG TPA: P-loop NTPase [Acidimicrobiales bacterium]|nr:P-loop NTPase [Acidimicrobiales bacterium]
MSETTTSDLTAEDIGGTTAPGSLRVAVAGKGGAGKTTLSATLARLMARRGKRVVVVDGDSNPNVAVALGVDRAAAAATAPLPTSLVSRRLDGTALKEPVAAVVDRFGTAAPDGIRVLLMAMPSHADEGCLCSAHATVSGLLNDVGTETDVVTILDLEASPEHLSRGTTRNVDVLLLVVEPYYRSYETARRMAALAAELPIKHVGVIANKLRRPGDLEAMAEYCERHNLNLDGHLPWSDAVLDADLVGTPLYDFAPDDPVVAAVDEVADRLLTLRR